MKKVIFIIVGILIAIFVVMAIFGYFLEKSEIEEITPKFTEMYKEALVIYGNDQQKGIKALEDALYYGHSHNLVAYKDVLITGYNAYYREGLNLLARIYQEKGGKLEEENKLDQALEIYSKIFNYTDSDKEIAYKKGSDFDLLFTKIKKLKGKIEGKESK